MTFKAAKFDLYWRLNSETGETKQQLTDRLLKGGYEVKKSLVRDQLLQLVQRMEFGSLCYDTCTYLELKQFALNRGLITSDRAPVKRALTGMLTKADDDRTFSKIPDLPPEIRKSIYELYISDFEGRRLWTPSQPPLARTCRLMRYEVLPIFYSKCAFRITFMSTKVASSNQLGAHFRLSDRSYIFLTTLAPQCIGDLRRLQLSFKARHRAIPWKLQKFKVDLRPGETSSKIFVRGRESCGRNLLQQCKNVLERVSKREGKKKLRLKDFYDLAVAVEHGIEQGGEYLDFTVIESNGD